MRRPWRNGCVLIVGKDEKGRGLSILRFHARVTMAESRREAPSPRLQIKLVRKKEEESDSEDEEEVIFSNSKILLMAV